MSDGTRRYEIWYEVEGYYASTIRKVRVTRETAHFLTIIRRFGNGKMKEERVAKVRDRVRRFYKSFDDAKSALVSRHERKAKSHREAANRCDMHAKRAAAIREEDLGTPS